jgi:peptide/nickel transport system substrate-binding protein
MFRWLLPLSILLALSATSAWAVELRETPYLYKDVSAGKLPAIHERLPKEPLIVTFDGDREMGRSGGELRTLIGRSKDVRLLVVYGYARLVAYNEDFEIVPDILKSFDVEEGRIFTFRLRKGHRWSDGQPFTVADFEYWWKDVANHSKLSPAGPPRALFVDGEKAKFEVLDEVTVRFSWSKPNPYFLPRLAGASPLFIFRPKHYLSQFHTNYADRKALKKQLRKHRTRNWASLHNRLDNMYRFDNPDLPTLHPWVNTSRPPATRFIAVRNPYYHRIDASGQQLPYIDKVYMIVADGKLIPAKAGTGEVDLQARSIAFNNYTFLRDNEVEGDFSVNLWRIAKGSHVALYPNMNINDPEWRSLFRDVRFRRALSLAVHRNDINESLYFGLALESNNTVLPNSPLYRKKYQYQWTKFDIDMAEELLDEIGLTETNDDDIRLLPSGRPLEIIVETAGEDTEQTDVLELISESWLEIGIKLFIKPSQREVFRNRIFSGEAMMSVWSGLENGVPTANIAPNELAPTSQNQLMWPKWGQHYETNQKNGEPPGLPEVKKLLELNDAWRTASSFEKRQEIWHEMLTIHAENVFSIGVVSGVQQPVVVKNYLKNVPKEGIYNWDPGAHFGVYRPDTFWIDQK